MLQDELKKLYVKQFGFISVIIFIICEIFFVNYIYPKREFSSEITERYFYEYMEQYSGRLSSQRESEIVAEQERIVDANNAKSELEARMMNGEFSSEDEFLSEYGKIQAVTERQDAFDIVLEMYNYALEAPETRYLTAGNYSGLGSDFPDAILLTFVIFLTATAFLNEESSNVITFIRISSNGRDKTFKSKLCSIALFIVGGWVFSTVMELFVMLSRGELSELYYPITTIEFFQNCPYKISILGGFFVISILKFLGYLFVSSLVILLSVTIRKPLFTIFIPCAMCVLQQFAFYPATPAYYLPTGFLRGVGYLRGNVVTTNYSGDEVKLFSDIPLLFLIILIIVTIVFATISIVVACNYYACRSINFSSKILASVALFSVICTISGCSDNSRENMRFNLWESSFFAQNDENFFVSSENNQITQISKIDGSTTPLIHEIFPDSAASFSGFQILYQNGSIYYHANTDINKISLANFSQKKAFGENRAEKGFLGINLSKKMEFGNKLTISTGFFIDGNTCYYVFNNGVMKDGKYVVDEEIYNGMLCFDGRKIYFVNLLLQLKSYDTVSGIITQLPGEFVNAIYYDGTQLLYSDKNGMFSLDIDDISTRKISDYTATRIVSCDNKIVYLSNGKLYLASETPLEIYDGEAAQFALVSGTNKLAVVQNNGEYELVNLPEVCQELTSLT